jgi:hypothetical protein
MAQISVTGRMDGSSAFKQATRTNYFYPSVTAGVIFSELFNLSNDWLSYGKLRGNWAKVGKDSPRYLFTDTYKQWVLFPDDNGTILMQSKDGKASISIGNNSYSFVSTKDGKVNAGQNVKFSAASALKTLRALA